MIFQELDNDDEIDFTSWITMTRVTSLLGRTIVFSTAKGELRLGDAGFFFPTVTLDFLDFCFFDISLR